MQVLRKTVQPWLVLLTLPLLLLIQLVLVHLSNLTVLRDCLLALLAETLNYQTDQNICIVKKIIKLKRNRVDGSDHKIYYIYQHVGHVGLLLNLLCYYFVSIFCLN